MTSFTVSTTAIRTSNDGLGSAQKDGTQVLGHGHEHCTVRCTVCAVKPQLRQLQGVGCSAGAFCHACAAMQERETAPAKSCGRLRGHSRGFGAWSGPHLGACNFAERISRKHRGVRGGRWGIAGGGQVHDPATGAAARGRHTAARRRAAAPAPPRIPAISLPPRPKGAAHE